MVYKNWLVFDDKTYLIEYLGKTFGGVLIAINGTEASYLSIATENGESAEFFCGQSNVRLDIDKQHFVSLWVNNTQRPPCSEDLAANFKPQKKKANVSLELLIVIMVTSLTSTGIIFLFECSNILQSGALISLAILAASVVLHFTMHQNDYAIWLSLGLVVTSLAVLLSAMFIDMDATDFRSLLLYLLPRAYYIVNITLYGVLVVKLIRIAWARYVLRDKR